MPEGRGTYGSKLGRPPFKGKQTKKGSMPPRNKITGADFKALKRKKLK